MGILAALSVAGCDGDEDPPPDRCASQKTCFPADELGCCEAAGTEVSSCDACPSGTVERLECRTSGCTDPCVEEARSSGAPADIAPALRCFENKGSGCCGEQVFNADACGECPAGTMPEGMCSTFSASCTCDEDTSDERSAGAAAEPAPSAPCFEDLGGGCCGDESGSVGACGCAPGTLSLDECRANTASDALIAPTTCREDLGGGCCGDEVPATACGTCPSGSIAESACGAMAESPGGSDFAAPIPLPETCYENLGEGCCGDAIVFNACQPSCPPDAIFASDCSAHAPACGS